MFQKSDEIEKEGALCQFKNRLKTESLQERFFQKDTYTNQSLPYTCAWVKNKSTYSFVNNFQITNT